MDKPLLNPITARVSVVIHCGCERHGKDLAARNKVPPKKNFCKSFFLRNKLNRFERRFMRAGVLYLVNRSA